MDGGDQRSRGERTSAALRDAALALFAASGFAETRVADIAEAAGTSERTFFRHFASKEDVALAGLTAWLDELVDAIESLPDRFGPVDALDAVLRQAEAGRFDFGPEPARDLVAYLRFPEVRAHLPVVTERYRLRLIAEVARRSDLPETDPYARVLASVLSAGLFSVMEAWLATGGGTDPWSLARDTMERVAQDVAATGLGRSTQPRAG